MRRKIAFGITMALTVLLAVLQPVFFPALSDVSLFGQNIRSLSLLLILLAFAAVTGLCLSRKSAVVMPHGQWSPICGWVSTFSGAVLTMTVLLDLFFFAAYGEVPAPGNYPVTVFDHILLYGGFLFALGSGLFLVLQGFGWMSGKADLSVPLRWLALCPPVWLWLRLARYEISYASTLDIEENFVTFATLVFSSLFFLQFARAVTGAGKAPKNSLLILALMTALVSLSATPAALVHQAVGAPLSAMMNLIVDAVIALTALVFAAMQVFSAPPAPVTDGEDGEEDEDEEEDGDDGEQVQSNDSGDPLSWELPKTKPAPVEPPFSMDQKLPVLDSFPVTPARYPARTKTEDVAPVEDVEPTPTPANSAPAVTVDELLSELESL